ncbi:MAG: SUMF1/EgtB/PvdO family nonheme iron enzyme [Prevotellaceae bacterium]|jgi:cytochrome c nitrite reductase small subunit|nr:SUMF1/EgtB/PvdO family nonheme iron enzyme [Prevotellaceae bacterium]
MIYKRKKKKNFRRKIFRIFFAGLIAGGLLMFFGNKYLDYTSSDEYCISCHIHPQADELWTRSSHHNTKSGVVIHCTDCHLPPKGSFNHLWTKGKMGLKDMWSYYTEDSASFDWQHRSRLEYAVKIVYNESCEKCHENLFTTGLSSKGAIAHLYYADNREKLDLQCISCHLDVGHYNPDYSHDVNDLFGSDESESREIYDSATKLTGFENFTEKVPGTAVAFNMIAIPGGTFMMGSPDNEPYRKNDEGPVREVTVSPFYMSEIEVVWSDYESFFRETRSEGRLDPNMVMEKNRNAVDAVSGPTPFYGQADQGWGFGKSPAITMSHYAAQIYCQWLSIKTGKKYRLPTEAEWEYAARGNTSSPYFFKGSPKKFTRDRWWNDIFGVDTAVINSYVIYAENSGNRTQHAESVAPNPFGLKNMLGNVMEYCSDWYSETAYSETPGRVTNPKGPEDGVEHVVRGGSFSSDAKDLRSASRDWTRTDEWLKTDPQSPKSIWWLSDCSKIGFRVVCERE